MILSIGITMTCNDTTRDSVGTSEKEVGWWRWGDSNPRPPHCERGALPAELHPQSGVEYIRALIGGQLQGSTLRIVIRKSLRGA